MRDSGSRENCGQRSHWPCFLVPGCLLIVLIGFLLMLRNAVPTGQPGFPGVPEQSSATGANTPRSRGVGSDRVLHGRSNSEPVGTADEIVAVKLVQFARSRRVFVR